MASKKQNRLLEGHFAGPAKTYARKVATRKIGKSTGAKPLHPKKSGVAAKIGAQLMEAY